MSDSDHFVMSLILACLNYLCLRPALSASQLAELTGAGIVPLQRWLGAACAEGLLLRTEDGDYALSAQIASTYKPWREQEVARQGGGDPARDRLTLLEQTWD